MIKEIQKLKGLESQLRKIEGELESLKIETSNKQKEYQQKLNIANKIKEEIKKLKDSKESRVSEHAIVRYFERVKGFNIEDIQKEILSDSIINLAEQLGGNGTYPNNGYSVVMKDFTVTTIIVK